MTAALRATTAAPWYMEELICEKELGYGSVEMSEKLGSSSSPSSLTSSAATTTTQAIDVISTSSAEHHKTPSSSSLGPNDILNDDILNDEDLDDDTEKARAKAKRGQLHGGGLNKLSPLESSRTQLRFIDGAISCNNPAAAAVFEAKRIFNPKGLSSSARSALDIPSPATSPPLTAPPGSRTSSTPLVTSFKLTRLSVTSSTQTRTNTFRFQPQGEIFSCALNDTSKETEKKLKQTALKYVNDLAQRKEIERLATLLKKPRVIRRV